MKKSFTKLLIISIVCAVISNMFCFFSIAILNNRTNQVLNETNSDEEISDREGLSDVDGYGYIIEASTSMLTVFGEAIGTFIFIILIPGFLLFMIVLSQCISRLVQIGDEKYWKNTTSKVFTYISIVLQVVLCFVLLFNILSNLIVNKILLVMALILNVACIVIFIKELAKKTKATTEVI